MVRTVLTAVLFLSLATLAPPTAHAVCGNGQMDAGEECDDGNTDNQDGCSYDCKEECPTLCTEWFDGCNVCACGEGDIQFCTLRFCSPEEIEPSMCQTFEEPCGNGQLDPGEECDDGNTDNRDGCSYDCKQECPTGCTEWFDGCNFCTCAAGDIQFCTLRFCSADQIEPSMCTEAEPVCGDGSCESPDEDPNTCPRDCVLAENAPDLTGTWTGKVKCTGALEGGDSTLKVTLEGTLLIDQVPSGELAATSNLTGTPSDGGDDVVIDGELCGRVAAPDGKSKAARASLASESPVNDVIFSAFIKTIKTFEPNGKGQTGKLRGKGPLSFAAQPGVVLGCTWIFDRTDENGPSLNPNQCDPS